MYHRITRYINTRGIYLRKGGTLMTHQKKRRHPGSTNPDHRPMPPVLRGPCDTLDHAIKGKRRTDPLLDPKHFPNWR